MTHKKMTALTGSAQTHPSSSHKAASAASVEDITVIGAGIRGSDQPLGSMPWRLSLSRHASLTQELNLPGPAAVSICSKRSSSNRMFLTVLFERSKLRLDFLSCIGMYHSCNVIPDGTYHRLSKQVLKAAKPAGATNTNGPLTKPLVEVTVMAMNKHTQTRPKYQYRFLAVSRQDRSVPPFRLCIDAGSEQEARRLLAPYFILSFAGQLPVQEARNA